MVKGLGDVSPAREELGRERPLPGRDVHAAQMLPLFPLAHGILIAFDLPPVRPRLQEIHRIGAVGVHRLADLPEAVFGPVSAEIVAGRVHLPPGGHANAVVVVHLLGRRLRPALVDDEPPVRVGMLEGGLPIFPADDLEGQQVGQHRQALFERPALHVRFAESDGFQQRVLRAR